MVKIQRIIIALLLLALFLLPSHAIALTRILNIRHWAAPDHTRIVIDTSDEAQYDVEKGERKISIDFKNATFPKTIPPEIILSKPGIDRITLMLISRRTVRVQLSLAENVNTNVFKLKKFQQKPDRVVIDIEFPEMEKKESEERQQVKVLRKDKIIIIDPGHGGEDAGAIGREGTCEKDVVLDISKKLRNILNKTEGYRAFLTRKGDYYVPFKKRLKIAREYGADLFLSIHADASLNRYARGSSVYCLSTGGASSEVAKVLARKENLADIVGGFPNGEGNNDESDPIILSMFQTNTINSSKCFGTILLKHLDTLGLLKFRNVQEAPFRVLKLPEIPSVLVETVYISNPTEEKLLRTRRFQEKIAEAIVASIGEFFPVHPSSTLELTNQEGKTESAHDDSPENRESRISTYKVKRGDTLSKIARKHGATLNSLLKLNGMRLNDPLYADRLLKIREPEVVCTYKVKRGDTLSKIARKHDTTLNSLLKLNGMRLNDPLYVNQILKLP